MTNLTYISRSFDSDNLKDITSVLRPARMTMAYGILGWQLMDSCHRFYLVSSGLPGISSDLKTIAVKKYPVQGSNFSLSSGIVPRLS